MFTDDFMKEFISQLVMDSIETLKKDLFRKIVENDFENLEPRVIYDTLKFLTENELVVGFIRNKNEKNKL